MSLGLGFGLSLRVRLGLGLSRSWAPCRGTAMNDRGNGLCLAWTLARGIAREITRGLARGQGRGLAWGLARISLEESLGNLLGVTIGDVLGDSLGTIEILKTPPARPARAQDMIIASHSNLSVVTSQTSVIPSHPLSALSAALAHTTRRISGINSLLARITHTHNY
jgi:hypothetical protein